jgi:hypothetical protein
MAGNIKIWNCSVFPPPGNVELPQNQVYLTVLEGTAGNLYKLAYYPVGPLPRL